MWVNVVFTPFWTFVTVIWTALLNSVDNSLYPTLFADYYGEMLGLDKLWIAALKVMFLALCAAINVTGVRVVGIFSAAVMILTLAPFVLMFLCQLPEGIDWQRVAYVPKEINWALFLPIISWNFSGFDGASHFIEEVKEPRRRNFISGLFLMIIAALATYIPPILAGVSASKLRHVPLSHWTDGYWVKVGDAVGGKWLATFVLVGGSLSTLGLMVTLLATTSRSLAGMGTINAFPSRMSTFMAKIDERSGTPANAIIVNAIITSILAVCLTFQTLVAVDQVLYSLRLICVLMCFLTLRLKQPNLVRPFRAPGGTFMAYVWALVPITFSLFLIFMSMHGSHGLYIMTLVVIGGSALASWITVTFFRKEGFAGKIITAEALDADIETYGTILDEESEEWRTTHPHLHDHRYSHH